MQHHFFSPDLMLRHPIGTPDLYRRRTLDEFLVDPTFQSVLFLATPGWFAQLENKNFIYDRLSDKEKVTLQKYVNRFCFRPTPFGLFAGYELWAGE